MFPISTSTRHWATERNGGGERDFKRAFAFTAKALWFFCFLWQIVIINGRDICLYKNDGDKPYLIYESRHKITSSKPTDGSSVVYYVPDFYEYEALGD